MIGAPVAAVLTVFFLAAQLSGGPVQVGQNMADVKIHYPSLRLEGRNSQGFERFWLSDSLKVLVWHNQVLAIEVCDRNVTVRGISLGNSKQAVTLKLGKPERRKKYRDALAHGDFYDVAKDISPLGAL